MKEWMQIMQIAWHDPKTWFDNNKLQLTLAIDHVYLTVGIILFLTVFLALFRFFKRLRKKRLVWLNCWFCHQLAKVVSYRWNSWTCPHCQQYNGFDEHGDYNKDINATAGISATCSLPKRQHTGKIDTFDDTNSSFTLCTSCQSKQLLKTRKLAAFVPTNEACFDEEASSYEKQSEICHQLCNNCTAGLHQHLSQQDYKIADYYQLHSSKLSEGQQDQYQTARRLSPSRVGKLTKSVTAKTNSILKTISSQWLPVFIAIYIEIPPEYRLLFSFAFSPLPVIMLFIIHQSRKWISLQLMTWFIYLGLSTYNNDITRPIGMVTLVAFECLVAALTLFDSCLEWLKSKSKSKESLDDKYKDANGITTNDEKLPRLQDFSEEEFTDVDHPLQKLSLNGSSNDGRYRPTNGHNISRNGILKDCNHLTSPFSAKHVSFVNNDVHQIGSILKPAKFVYNENMRTLFENNYDFVNKRPDESAGNGFVTRSKLFANKDRADIDNGVSVKSMASIDNVSTERPTHKRQYNHHNDTNKTIKPILFILIFMLIISIALNAYFFIFRK